MLLQWLVLLPVALSAGKILHWLLNRDRIRPAGRVLALIRWCHVRSGPTRYGEIVDRCMSIGLAPLVFVVGVVVYVLGVWVSVIGWGLSYARRS